MATFTWKLQGTSPTTIDSGTDVVEFAGAGGFGTAVTVAAWQDTSHVRTNPSTNKSSGNTPKNNKFISQAGGTGGDSQVDIGAGTVDLDTIGTANCALLVNFADASSVATSSAIFYAYDGSTTTAVPTGVDFRCAEQGDANWTEAEGSAAALGLTDQGASTSHDFFILASASPTSVGLKTAFSLRIELTYS
jgi:hypothetical protein